jgi:alpha/beta superfamily hydrolase
MPKSRIQWAITIILAFLAFSAAKNAWDIYAVDPFPEQTEAVKEQEEELRKLKESYKELDEMRQKQGK